MTVTRWGILGAASFAREHMAPAIAKASGGTLAALATRDPQKAAPFQKLSANITVYGSYDELLADPNIDAVYIPLPNDMHTPWAIKALNWLKMREIYQSGVLGDLRRVESVFSYDNSSDTGNIRLQGARGGGSVPDIGVYPYGAVRFVTGQEPLGIACKDVSRVNGVDITTFVRADFDGFAFNATTSMHMAPWQSMEFHGTQGIARLHVPFNAGVFGEAKLDLHLADGQTQSFRWPTTNQYVLQVEAFQRALQGESYACPLEFSRGTQAMIDVILGD